APARDDVRDIVALASMGRLVVLRRLAGRLFSRTFLLLLSFLLLFLLQFLLLLPVFLFELLELLLLFLLDLLPSAVFGILLLNLLLLLDLLLFDSLAFLILSLTELFQLLLMLLIELWVHRGVRAAAVRPRGWRAVVVRLVPSVVCRRITRLITRGRLYSVVGSWRLIRIILNVRLLLPRTIDAVVDRKSTRLNSSHLGISYAVFCLKKKTAVI